MFVSYIRVSHTKFGSDPSSTGSENEHISVKTNFELSKLLLNFLNSQTPGAQWHGIGITHTKFGPDPFGTG